jgi:hypothetical protein
LQQVWINKASIRFKVIGNSPLRLLEGNLTYEVVPSKVDGPPGSFGSFVPNLPKRPKYGDIIDYTNSPSLGKVHPPDGEVGIATSLESTILTAQDVKALEDGECFLCVYGFMRYKDPVVSWKRRETRYCFACGNWGVTSPKVADGYFVAGPAEYNDVMDIPRWKNLWHKAMRPYRKAKNSREKAN